MSTVILHRGNPTLWSPAGDPSTLTVYRNLVGLNKLADRDSYLATQSSENFGNSLDVTKLRLTTATAAREITHAGQRVIRAGEVLEITSMEHDHFIVATRDHGAVSVSFKQVAFKALDAGKGR